MKSNSVAAFVGFVILTFVTGSSENALGVIIFCLMASLVLKCLK